MKTCDKCGGSGVYVLSKEFYDRHRQDGNYTDYEFKLCPCVTEKLSKLERVAEAAKVLFAQSYELGSWGNGSAGAPVEYWKPMVAALAALGEP